MSRTTTRILIALSVLSISGIVFTQVHWMRSEYRLQEQRFLQTVTKALDKAARRVAQPAKDISPDIQVISLSPAHYLVNLNVPINSQKLKFCVGAELELHQILAPFEHGLYDPLAGQIIYEKTPQQTVDFPPATGPIQPIQSPYYFVVRFPGQAHYLMQQMDYQILLSAIVLLLTAFFGYLFYGLFRQKSRTQTQREFMNNMTHELQTPISSIKLATDVLLTPQIIEQPERMRKYVRMVQEETMRLQQQVETVLTVGRSETNDSFKLQPVSIDMHELLFHLAERHGDYLHLELHAAYPVIQADRMHLINVVSNLVDNAVKYTPNNPFIRLITRNEKGSLVMVIQDNGIGISPEHQPHIFSAYYRAPGANAVSVKGFGLGLSYVYKIIKAHHWKITLNSALGQGSAFSIQIPQPTVHVQNEVKLKT